MLRMLVLVLALAQSAAAQTPAWPDAEDPAFAAARAAWLSGSDDMATLGSLAALAQSGNRTAQVMLGRLVADGLVSAEVGDLPRDERIALTRAPGGLSGTSWLRVAAESDPLAAALEAASVVSLGGSAELEATLDTLLDAGEARAAFRLLGTAYNQGGSGPHGGWTLTARHGAHPALQGHGRRMLDGLRSLLTDPTTGVVDPAMLAMGTASLAALDAAPLPALDAPLAKLCAAGCPGTAAACTDALAQAVGGVVGHLTLSPVESIVASPQYQESPRFASDLGRRLSGAVDQVAARDACAASLIE